MHCQAAEARRRNAIVFYFRDPGWMAVLLRFLHTVPRRRAPFPHKVFRMLAGGCIAGSGLALTAAYAEQPYVDIQVASWAAACVTCHAAVVPVKGLAIPALAGMPASQIIKKMTDYAAADAPGSLMGQIARGYDPQTIARIAQWYSRLAPQTP